MRSIFSFPKIHAVLDKKVLIELQDQKSKNRFDKCISEWMSHKHAHHKKEARVNPASSIVSAPEGVTSDCRNLCHYNVSTNIRF